jgi:hypothetical protein
MRGGVDAGIFIFNLKDKDSGPLCLLITERMFQLYHSSIYVPIIGVFGFFSDQESIREKYKNR